MFARGGVARAAGAVVAFAAAVGAIRAEDASKDLLQRAKQALAKKKYEEAEDLFAQAAAADPPAVGARYWIGQVREKAGDDIGAIDAYREFLDGARWMASAASLAAEDRDLLKKAGARLASLAPGDAEYAKLRRAFADELRAFAASRRKEDPVGATLALETLVSVEEDAAALEMLDVLTQNPDAEGEAAWRKGLPLALRPIRAWRDLFKLQAFGDDAPPRLTYAPPGMIIERDEGGLILRRPYPTGASYALAMEFQATPIGGSPWTMGFAVKLPDNQHWALGLMDGKVQVGRKISGETWRSWVIAPTAAAPDTWHRLEALVRGDRVQIWFDGQQKGDARIPVARLEGELGLIQAGSRVQVRLARHAVLD
jgi:hypothetical protein